MANPPKRCLNHILFYAANVIVTLMAFCVIPILFLAPVAWYHRVSQWWCVRLLAYAEYFLDITWRITGTLPVFQDAPYLVACAHQSVWETLALNVLFPNPAFVLKSSLLQVPVLGWYLKRLGMIPVHRGHMISKTFLEAARHIIAQQRSIVIFPEGKRVPINTPVRCRRGIAFLYQKLHIPVVVISVNSGAFWPPRTFFKRAGCIEAKIHPIIPPGLEEGDFLAQLQKNLEEGNRALLTHTSLPS
jgi:1-acyl-sn-glycerol-3-phosphate acyltransferase